MYKVEQKEGYVEIVSASKGYHTIFEALTDLLQQGYKLRHIVVSMEVLLKENSTEDLLNCWKVYG